MRSGTQSPLYDDWGRDPQAPLPIRFAALGIAGVLRTVYATARGVCLQKDIHDRILKGEASLHIGILWHSQIALPSFFFGGVPRVCLVSRSPDGELLARLVSHLGSRSIRGSSNSLSGKSKGGGIALRAMLRAIENGYHLVVTPDGPKGPAERIKPGAILIGAMSGRPIIPMGFAASKFFRLKTWDRTIIPVPFTRIALSYGEPLVVPRTDDPALLEKCRCELENRLQEANRRAIETIKRTGG